MDDSKGKGGDKEDGQQTDQRMLHGGLYVSVPCALIQINSCSDQDRYDEDDHIQLGGQPEPEKQASRRVVEPTACVIGPQDEVNGPDDKKIGKGIDGIKMGKLDVQHAERHEESG